MVDFKSAALALLSVAVSAAEDEQLRVLFVNQFPNKSIELFWENHNLAADHPDRRRFEAVIPPRGGWHKSETYLGHGKL